MPAYSNGQRIYTIPLHMGAIGNVLLVSHDDVVHHVPVDAGGLHRTSVLNTEHQMGADFFNFLNEETMSSFWDGFTEAYEEAVL